jgi:superkiller protein 3
MGLLSKDDQDVLDEAAKLIEKARGSRADKAPAAWAKAAEFLDRNRAKVTDRRTELADRLVEVGKGFGAIGDNAAALASWKRALEVQGRHMGAFHALASAFESAGNPTEALRYFDQAVQANPDGAAPLSAKAKFLLRRGDRKGAQAMFERLHHVEPDQMEWVLELCELDAKNAKWWLARAKAAHQLKDRAGAMKWSAKAAELATDDPLPRVYTSLLLEEGGDLKAALKAADEGVVLSPSHKEANRQRARLLTKMGDEGAALEAWNKMTRVAPDDPRGWLEVANLQFRGGKFEEASLHFDTACKLSPGDGELWRNNASAKEALGKWPEALAALEGAERAGGADAALRKRKAAVLLKMGRAPQALEEARGAARLDPRDRGALERILDALGAIEPRRNEDFVTASDQLLKIDPDSERGAVEKARSLSNQAKWKEAVAAAEQGLRRHAGSITLWRLKAAAHKAMGQHEQVAAACDSILRIDAKDTQAGVERGEALFELGRFPEALEAYNALLRLDPTHAFASTRRGQCLQRTNRHREAVEAFDHVLARDKENVLAHRLKAESLAALGHHREAIAEMDVAIGADPSNVKMWLYKASLHQQGGEVDAAKRCLAKALEAEPRNLEALGQRASLLLSRGQAKEALADLQSLTAGHPDHAEGWLLFAEALEAVDRPDEARTAIRRALALNERDALALRQAASLELRAGKPREAAAFLERAVGVDDKDLNTVLDLGEAYEAAGELEKSLGAFEGASRLLPGDRDIAGLTKAVLRKLRRDADVERLCVELLMQDPRDVDALFDLAIARRNQGNLEGAHESAVKLVELRPQDVHVLNELGIILSELGRHQGAVDVFSRALEADPKAEHALVNKALALRRLGEHREALACLREAVEINPHEAANWNLLGLTYSALDMHSKALEAYDRGLEVAPNHTFLLNNKGKALVDTGNLEGAVECFTAATASDPRDEKAQLNLGISLDRLGRLDEAEVALERARELNPTSPDILNNLGRVKMSKRDFAGALTVFEAAVKGDPKTRPAWVNRGICLDNLDRFEEAIVSYRRALDLEPADYLTWHNMGLAYFSLRRYDDALPCFDKAHKLNLQHQASLDKRSECADIIKEREIERYARKILDFEFNYRKRPTREEAFRMAGVPIQHLDDALVYLGADVRLDLMGISREELHDLEKASAAVLKYMMTPEAAARGDPVNVTLAELLHHFPETSIRRAKKILKYLAEVDRLRIDAKKTVTPDLERAVQQAVKIPPERRNIREISVTLNAGILRSKRVLQILKSLEKELDIPAHEVTIRSIKDAGWKIREADDDLEEEDSARRGKRKVREEEPEFVVDVRGAEPVHAAPSFAREFSQYAGAPAPDAVTGPPVARPRVYCSSCKIRGASYRHNECGEFLCDVCLERFNQVEHLTAGIKLLCPVCEAPIRDLGEATAKWDRL